MEVLRSFILPKWWFRLVLGKVTIATTCWLYQEVQRVVQQTLQAPSNLSKKWIHLEMKKGGLGIPDALEMTYLGKARLAGRLSNSKDGNVQLVYDTRLWGSELSGFERHLRRQRDLDLVSRHTSLSEFRWQRWCNSAQGRDAEAFVDQRNNFVFIGQGNNWWLREGGLNRKNRRRFFIFASKLRSQILACSESMTRLRGKSIPPCRACGEDRKTISHILQNRKAMTDLRIWLHNTLLDVVKRRLKKDGHVVCSKPRIVSPLDDRILRPDLCAKTADSALILDAHCPYKLSAQTLTVERDNKISKYSPHGDSFRKYLGCNDLLFDGVVDGLRRSIEKSMSDKLLVLGLSEAEVQLMQVRVIEGL